MRLRFPAGPSTDSLRTPVDFYGASYGPPAGTHDFPPNPLGLRDFGVRSTFILVPQPLFVLAPVGEESLLKPARYHGEERHREE